MFMHVYLAVFEAWISFEQNFFLVYIHVYSKISKLFRKNNNEASKEAGKVRECHLKMID